MWQKPELILISGCVKILSSSFIIPITRGLHAAQAAWRAALFIAVVSVVEASSRLCAATIHECRSNFILRSGGFLANDTNPSLTTVAQLEHLQTEGGLYR